MTSAVFRKSAIALAIVALAGCSTWDSMTKTGQATTVGAASGAVGGAVVGGPVGAVAGGAIGGVAGHELAKSEANETTSRTKTSTNTSTAPNSSNAYASSSTTPSPRASGSSSYGTTASSAGTGASTGMAANAESRPTPSTSASGSTSTSTSPSRDNSVAMNHPSSSSGSKMQGTRMMSRDEYLRAVQESLNDQGYDAGKVDGKWGPKTAAALKKFQGDHGLQANGQIDAQTISALGITQPADSSTMGAASSADKTAAKSSEKTASNSSRISSTQ